MAAPQESTQALAVNADGQVQPPSGGPTEEILECKLCCSEFGPDPVDALVCGHVFHTDCIHKWMEFIRKPKAECCPHKCHCVQVPTEDGAQMMDDDNDQQVGDSNIDDEDKVDLDDLQAKDDHTAQGCSCSTNQSQSTGMGSLLILLFGAFVSRRRCATDSEGNQ